MSLNGDTSLLQATFERVRVLSGGSMLLTVASVEHRFLVNDAAASAGVEIRQILEPVGRNTAAAMAAAALNVERDRILLFVPSDHYVPDAQLFSECIRLGIESAVEGKVVVFGIVPTRPHTGYGYIEAIQSDAVPLPVKSFVEKPDIETAIAYLRDGNYYWNAGIFMMSAGTLCDALERHAPDILASVTEAVAAQTSDGTFVHLDNDAFAGCRSDSIDYAVLEHCENLAMIPYRGAWSDVGSWAAVAELIEPDTSGNRVVGHGISRACTSTYIHAPRRPVVALGTSNLLIVDTADALLVADKDYSEQVKDVVSELQAAGVPQASAHRHSVRPWGEYDVINEGHRFKVKHISVKPGTSLSLQLHHHRAEHWIVVNGTARVTRGEETFLLHENESTYIPVGARHRLENPGPIMLEVIEIQSGSYLEEDDIVRFEDHYGRSQ